mmetsp:Transcript_35438/g.64454  ORF Transcript_35438/g.64454 Transcript_35438/m.64454 type:complete len:324 (-) Transcript_35438:460-1431(-)
MVGLREGLVVGRHDAFDRRLQVFQRGLDLGAFGGVGLLDGRGQQVDRVIALGGGHRRVDARVLRVEGAQVVDDEALALGRRRLLDEGLRHARALAAGAGVVDEVGHGQRPGADHRHLPAQLRHPVGDLREFRADGIGQDGLGAGLLGLEQLGRHVDVLDIELLDRDRRDVLQLERGFQVGAAELAVVGAVRQDGHLLVATLDDGLLDDHRRLDRVMRGVAEDVVLGLAFELLGDDGAGGHVVHHRNLGFLIEALRGQGHAGVDVADGGDHLFLVDELLGDLHATFILGLIVALDEQNLAAQHATGLVDLVGGQAHAITHADAH